MNTTRFVSRSSIFSSSRIAGALLLAMSGSACDVEPGEAALAGEEELEAASEAAAAPIPLNRRWALGRYNVYNPPHYANDISVWMKDRFLIDYGSNGHGRWEFHCMPYGTEDGENVSADYDGDGLSDLAIRNTQGQWKIDYLGNSCGHKSAYGTWDLLRSYPAPLPGITVIPTPADYDGDGKADISEKRSDNRWYIDYSIDGFNGWDVIRHNSGGSDARPVPGRYNADPYADIAIKDNTGTWRIDYFPFDVRTQNVWDVNYPGKGDNWFTPLTGNFDGDGQGITEMAVTNAWGELFLNWASDGYADDWDHKLLRTWPNRIVAKGHDMDLDGYADEVLVDDLGNLVIAWSSNAWATFGYQDSLSNARAPQLDPSPALDRGIYGVIHTTNAANLRHRLTLPGGWILTDWTHVDGNGTVAQYNHLTPEQLYCIEVWATYPDGEETYGKGCSIVLDF